MLISLIVAMTPSGVIGAGGKLPWHLPADLQHFKRTTTGHAIVMGRKTFDSIGRRALPNRRTLVVSHVAPTAATDAEFLPTIDAAIDAAQAAGESELFVVGGSQIYAATLPVADRLYITWITLTPEPQGDTFFPAWDRSVWKIARTIPVGEMQCVVYERQR